MYKALGRTGVMQKAYGWTDVIQKTLGMTGVMQKAYGRTSVVWKAREGKFLHISSGRKCVTYAEYTKK